MPRKLVDHGTYRAYLRCKSRPEGACEACVAAAEARNAVRRGETAADDAEVAPRPLAMLPGAASADEKVDVDARKELLENMKLVRAAMDKVTEADPLKIVNLSKRHSELVGELRALGATVGGIPSSTSEEADPFEQFFGPGGAPRRSATAPRT